MKSFSSFSTSIAFFLLSAELLCALAIAPIATAAPAESSSHKANNLEQAKTQIKTKAGKQVWQSEMEGKDSFALGLHLPENLTRDELSQLVFGKPYSQMLKMKDSDTFQGLAAVQYPGRDGIYVAAGSIQHSSYKGSGPSYADIEIVVFKMPAPHQTEVLARTTKPMIFADGIRLDIKSDDSYNNIEDELVTLDHATFKIASDKYAFGLRLSHNDSYGGGFGKLQYLHLFTVEHGQISNVYGSIIYDFQLLAGDWNKDETRQHSTYEDNYVLCVDKSVTHGYFDLTLVQTRGGRKRFHYIWDEMDKGYAGYLPKGAEPEPYVQGNAAD